MSGGPGLEARLVCLPDLLWLLADDHKSGREGIQARTVPPMPSNPGPRFLPGQTLRNPRTGAFPLEPTAQCQEGLARVSARRLAVLDADNRTAPS